MVLQPDMLITLFFILPKSFWGNSEFEMSGTELNGVSPAVLWLQMKLHGLIFSFSRF